jgi:HPt (histidine-containing phosphotransfer) domain-containing protein
MGLGDAFIKEMVETFIKEIPKYLKNLDEAFDMNDRVILRRVLHSLKPHSQTLCMSELKKKLAYWEENIADTDLSKFEPDLQYIKQNWNDALEDLKSIEDGEYLS